MRATNRPRATSAFRPVAATAIVAAGLFGWGFAQQQPGNIIIVPRIAPQFVPGGEGTGETQLFVFDRTGSRMLRRAEERAEAGNYEDAVQLLQSLLDAEEDSVVAPSDDPEGEGTTVRSLKAVAEESIERLPPEGRRIYELKYGVTAEGRLKAALADSDWNAVEEISRRYFHTSAGYDAAYRVAARAIDRADFVSAALIYARLAKAPTAVRRFGPTLILREMQAWRTAGLPQLADAAKERLTRSGSRIAIGEAGLGIADSVRRVSKASSPTTTAGWPMVGRGPDRNGVAAEAAPVGEAAWTADLLAADPLDGPLEAERTSRLRRLLDDLDRRTVGSDLLRQPAFQPLVVGDLAVVRTFRDVSAFDLTSGRVRWRTERTNDNAFDWALDQIAEPDADGVRETEPVSTLFATQTAWQNSATGSLSSDGRRVYAVEGVGIHASGMLSTFPGVGGPAQLWQADHDSLVAYDATAEGRIDWILGGPAGPRELGGTFFLGPPLPIGGRLYVLTEVGGEIRLMTLDPNAEPGRRLIWSQSLVHPELGVRDDPVRRLSGLAPAFSGGVLVCPTAAGAIMGVDVGRRQLLWGYQYPRKFASAFRAGFPRATMAAEDSVGRWLDGSPTIADGVVVVTPRDSDELHCLDLTSGRLLWKRRRGDGLYVAAVTDGKVVVVGRSEVKAFDAASGAEAWPALTTGEPAGRGVRCGDVYHLPLVGGEILSFRLDSGRPLVRSPVEGAELGNLIAVDGRVLSQSARSVVVFRPLADTESRTRAALLAAPEDAAALAVRGELRLHRGETRDGLDDLRRAITIADLPRARRLLAAGLLTGLRSEFRVYRPYAEDLRRLATDPTARIEFLLVYGRGLIDAGEPTAAFGEFASLCETNWSPPLERLADGRSVRADRLLRVRLGELRRGLSEPDRDAVDAMLRGRLAALRTRGEIGPLRRFAELFGDTPAGDAALVAIADLLSATGSAGAAEQALLQAAESGDRDVAMAAGERLGGYAVGAFGSELPPVRFARKLEAEFIADQVGNAGPRTSVTALEPVEVAGPRPEAFAGWLFGFDPLSRQLVARDPFGRERWRFAVVGDPEVPVLANPFGVTIRFSGHTAAIAFVDRVVVADLLGADGAEVSWSRELLERFGRHVVPPAPPRQVVLPGGRRRLVLRDAANRPLKTRSDSPDRACSCRRSDRTSQRPIRGPGRFSGPARRCRAVARSPATASSCSCNRRTPRKPSC